MTAPVKILLGSSVQHCPPAPGSSCGDCPEERSPSTPPSPANVHLLSMIFAVPNAIIDSANRLIFLAGVKMPANQSVPLTIAGRSPFDPIRIRWSGAGNLLIALYCMFGAGGAGGIIFGILFAALGITTWAITRFGEISWNDLFGISKFIASTGAIIGTAFLYLLFCWLFFIFFVFRVILGWMAE